MLWLTHLTSTGGRGRKTDSFSAFGEDVLKAQEATLKAPVKTKETDK